MEDQAPKPVLEEAVEGKPQTSKTNSTKRHRPRRPVITPLGILLVVPLLVTVVAISYLLLFAARNTQGGPADPEFATLADEPTVPASDGRPAGVVEGTGHAPVDEMDETVPEPVPDETVEVLLAVADRELAEGTAQRALNLYRTCAIKYPTSAEAWLGYTKCASKLGNRGLTLSTFAYAIEAIPGNLEVRLAYAAYATASGDVSLAAEQSCVAAKIAPDSHLTWMAAAEALFASRQDREALAHAQKAAELAENDVSTKILNGQILLRLGELDAAEAMLLDANALAPENPSAILSLAEVNRRRGKHARAAELLAKAVAAVGKDQTGKQTWTGQVPSQPGPLPAGLPPGARIDPAGTLEVRTQLERAELLLAQGKGAEAVEVLRALQQKHPRLVKTRFRLGELLLLLGQAEESVELARKLTEEFPREPSGTCLLAEIYLAKGLFSDAARECQKALWRQENHPHQIRARKVHALILARMGKPKQAATEMADYLTLRPNDSDAGLRYVGMLVKAGRSPDAVAWTETFDSRFPKSPGPQLARAALMVELADFPKAVEAYQEALRRGATGVKLHNNLAWYLAVKLGKPGEALRYAQAGAKLRQGGVGVSHTLGWCLFLTGKADEALPLLEAAARAVPNSPTRRYTLAAAAAKLGRDEKAKREVKAALELSDSFEFAEKARQLQAQLAAK